MRPLSQASARYAILMVAAVYMLIVGSVEAFRHIDAVDAATASELLSNVTAVASLSVGAIIGFYLASQPRQS